MTGSFSTTIDYNNASNFIYNSSLVEITTDAHLILQPNAGQTFNQPFTSSVGFTFDAAKTEFVAGKLQQKDLKDAAWISWATYTNSIDLSCGPVGSVLTGTGVGGAAISGNRLDLAHNDVRYVTYDANLNADMQDVGAIKFKVTPNYSGSPDSNQYFVSISESR